MRSARATCLGVGLALGMLGGGLTAAQEPRAELLVLRLANLTTAPESARVGFAFDLEGPPLVDELPAGALTTLLPGRPDPGELWILPRGQTLPKSLPEPLPLAGPGPRSQASIRSVSAGANTGATAGAAAVVPGEAPPASVTVFLIDRPGPRGDLARQLVIGAQAPAEGAQLRVLNLVGAPELDVCAQGEAAAPIARAIPAWGLSRFAAWSPPAALGRGAATGLTFRVAAEPACRGPKLAAVNLRLAERGAWTLVAQPVPPGDRREGAPALRVLLLDEGSFLPERALALPSSSPPLVEGRR